jgi:glutamate-1-semialdehyde 2,1-aminomutase
MAMFGKAMGNGYSITAVIGRREVMEAAQKTFISSTFWTERIGPSAALKTLEVMEREQSWKTITETGNSIAKRWVEIANVNELPIQISGLPALIGFSIMSDKSLSYKTFITQEMLNKGYLAATSIYVSIVHTSDILNPYFDQLDKLFKTIRKCEQGKLSIDSLLSGPVCHGGFKRLN